MAVIQNAVAYCRYSSDMQREESIEAQTRAIKEYAERNGYALQKIYADRGISGTTDQRPQFQEMVEAVRKGGIAAVIVHKYDRFARNRADSAIYRREIEKQGAKLISVLESFDDSPESVILQSVIEGYNEYYSRNLRREVMKGLKENALSCRHTGGIPCLGYDVDKETMRLVINEWEAKAVALIFRRYLEGAGYSAIIEELNGKGFRTKRGVEFGKNSLYEILRNEKYCGVYTYNVSTAKNAEGKFNRHRKKSEEDIIRVEDGVPAIISKDDFEKVQMKMAERKQKTASYKAKQEYLLSGKLVCGECGCSYAGNSRKANATHPLYVSYRCTKKNGQIRCKNPEVRRDSIEGYVLKMLADKVFDEKVLPEVIRHYNDFAASKNTEALSIIATIKEKIFEKDKGIANVVNVVVQTGSVALTDKLKELERDKEALERSLAEKERELSELTVDEKVLKRAFRKAKKMLETGTLINKKAIIERYVKKVMVYKDRIAVEFNVTDTYSIVEEVERSLL